MRWQGILIIMMIGLSGLLGPVAGAAEFVVYSVYRPLDLGISAEPPPKDFFINMGTAQGVQSGTVLTVFRRAATYDLLSEKLFREVTFPIARIKVIHSEAGTAVARLDKMISAEKAPGITPNAIMIGDLVRLGDQATP